jgi:hypothetical protein
VTRRFRTRWPLFLSNWWNRTVLLSVAVNRRTGTFTSPKLIAPLQIALAMRGAYHTAPPLVMGVG